MNNDNNQHLILTVCVIYNTDLLASSAYKTLLRFSDDVIIIDNSPVSGIKSLPNARWKLLTFPENPGLSHAYNRAAEYGEKYGYKWLLISDQDTIFPERFYETLKFSIERYPSSKLFCPLVKVKDNWQLSPTPLNYFLSHLIKYPQYMDTDIKLKKFAIINSGLFIDISTYFEAGGYNEAVFLDYSDFQFIERLSKNIDTAHVLDCTCIQDFSNESHDLQNKSNRFRMFCRSTKRYDTTNALRKIMLNIAVIKRMLSLTLEFKNLDFLKTYIKYYICSNTNR